MWPGKYYYPGQKNWDSHAPAGTGPWSLEHARACSLTCVPVSIFLARVVVATLAKKIGTATRQRAQARDLSCLNFLARVKYYISCRLRDVDLQYSTLLMMRFGTVSRMYSLVQWNWSSDVTWCMQLRCIQWPQRTNFTAPDCTCTTLAKKIGTATRQRAQARDLSSMHAPVVDMRACFNFFGQGSSCSVKIMHPEDQVKSESRGAVHVNACHGYIRRVLHVFLLHVFSRRMLSTDRRSGRPLRPAPTVVAKGNRVPHEQENVRRRREEEDELLTAQDPVLFHWYEREQCSHGLLRRLSASKLVGVCLHYRQSLVVECPVAEGTASFPQLPSRRGLSVVDFALPCGLSEAMRRHGTKWRIPRWVCCLRTTEDNYDEEVSAWDTCMPVGEIDIYTISPGCRGSMAKSRSATAAQGPQARGLPRRAEMQPNCPGYQERLCLSSWNRYSTRTGKARKNRTRRRSFLARKNDRNFQPCEIANISPRAEICNLTWLESADSVLAKQVPVQSSKVHVRSQNLTTFIRRSDWSVPWLQTCDIW